MFRIFDKINNNEIYVIAEMSANHGGSLENALKIVREAAKAGADCLKIQTYTADSITIDCDNEYFRVHGGLWDGYSLYQLYEYAGTPYEWQARIKEECDKVGMDFLSTPFDDVAIDASDPKVLKVTLAKPCAYFLDMFANVPTFMPSNCKYAKDEDKLWDMDPAKNLGNGPWYMAERKPGEYILYKKNPYYYDAENVNLLSIKMRFMDDNQAKAAAYQTGELTILTGAPSSIAERYQGKPDLKITEVPQTNYIMMNPNIAPFDNPKVRKAFALALKRKDIATVVGMSCVPSTTFVGRFYHSKVDGTPWGELQGNLLDEDLEEAKKLLAEAGYPDGKGLPKITYTYPSMSYEGDVAQVLQQQWKLLGVEVELQALENEVYVAQRRQKKDQMIRMQWYADYNDPTTWLMMYVTGNSLNDINWNNKKYDDLIAKSDLELDAKKRQDMLLAAEKIAVSEDTVIVPLFTNNNTNLYPPELTNYYNDVIGYPNYTGMKVEQK